MPLAVTDDVYVASQHTFNVKTGIDLTGATSLQINLRDESGNVALKTGANSGTPTDGIIVWTSAVSDFDAVGYWYGQAVTLISSVLRYGKPFVIPVREVLK